MLNNMRNSCAVVAATVLCLDAVLLSGCAKARSPRLVRFVFDQEGTVVDDQFSLPLARFDKLEIVASMDEHGNVVEPYRVLCTRMQRASGLKPIKDALLFCSESNTCHDAQFLAQEKEGGAVRRLTMPHAFGDGDIRWRLGNRNRIYVATGVGRSYRYGRTWDAMLSSDEHARLLLWHEISPSKKRPVRSGTGRMRPRLPPEGASCDQGEDEYFCRTWYVGSDGTFILAFFLRDLSRLENLVAGRVEGKIDMSEHRLISQKTILEVEKTKIDVELASCCPDDAHDDVIVLSVRHGYLGFEEKFPISEFIRHVF